MRVITGEFRGLRLNAVPGNQTRPTADKVKESMFNMLGPFFEGGQALDLYAGTGALGIEAVSRGMDHATLVDRQFAAIKTIRENIDKTHASERFTVMKAPVAKALAELAKTHYDLIMADPPYAKQEVLKQLAAFLELDLLAENGVVMLETGLDVTYPEQIAGFEILRHQTYGVAQVLILQKAVKA